MLERESAKGEWSSETDSDTAGATSLREGGREGGRGGRERDTNTSETLYHWIHEVSGHTHTQWPYSWSTVWDRYGSPTQYGQDNAQLYVCTLCRPPTLTLSVS